MEILIIIVAVASAIWVYVDATGHKIGKTSGKGGLFNMSAGAWSIVTLLLWIVGFPAYLIKRRILIADAINHPVEVTARAGKIAALTIVGALWVLGTLVGSVEQTDGGMASATDLSESITVSDLEMVANSFGGRSITGVATNNTDHAIHLTNLEFNLYDDAGVQVGSTITNVENLKPHGKWRFEAVILEEAATQYELTGITIL